MTQWHPVGMVDDLVEGEPAAVVAGGKAIALFRVKDDVFALHDLCTHGAVRLSEGYVEDCTVECPLHQGLFDLRTGEAKCAPATEAVRTFPIRITEGQVNVYVE